MVKRIDISYWLVVKRGIIGKKNREVLLVSSIERC